MGNECDYDFHVTPRTLARARLVETVVLSITNELGSSEDLASLPAAVGGVHADFCPMV